MQESASPLSGLQRKSNKPMRFIIESVDSAAGSAGDTAIYWEPVLTLLGEGHAQNMAGNKVE